MVNHYFTHGGYLNVGFDRDDPKTVNEILAENYHLIKIDSDHVIWIGNGKFDPDKNALDFGKAYFCKISDFEYGLKTGTGVIFTPLITDPNLFETCMSLIIKIEDMIEIIKHFDGDNLSKRSIFAMRAMLRQIEAIKRSLK